MKAITLKESYINYVEMIILFNENQEELIKNELAKIDKKYFLKLKQYRESRKDISALNYYELVKETLTKKYSVLIVDDIEQINIDL